VPYAVAEHLIDAAGPAPFDNPALTLSEWAEFDSIALEQMLPSMYNGFSLPNFLFEMKDFRRLAYSVHQKKGRLSTLVFGDDEFANAKLSKALSSKKLKDRPLKALSKTYLNYSFAWAPLVSDIAKMYKLVRQFDKRLAQLQDRANKPQTRHFSIDLATDVDESKRVKNWSLDVALDVSVSDNVAPYNPNWCYLVRRSRDLVPSVYRATCRFYYKLPDISGERLRLRAWLDAFGVRPDPSIIWNAIPFSFIVDWIIDVGGWLRRFSHDNLGLEIVVEDFCSSQKRETIVDYGYAPIWASDPLNQEDVRYVGTRIRKEYERRAGIPSIHGVSTASVPGLKQLSLAAALLGSRRRR